VFQIDGTYCRKMMKGYFESAGIRCSSARIGESLARSVVRNDRMAPVGYCRSPINPLIKTILPFHRLQPTSLKHSRTRPYLPPRTPLLIHPAEWFKLLVTDMVQTGRPGRVGSNRSVGARPGWVTTTVSTRAVASWHIADAGSVKISQGFYYGKFNF